MSQKSRTGTQAKKLGQDLVPIKEPTEQDEQDYADLRELSATKLPDFPEKGHTRSKTEGEDIDLSNQKKTGLEGE